MCTERGREMDGAEGERRGRRGEGERGEGENSSSIVPTHTCRRSISYLSYEHISHTLGTVLLCHSLGIVPVLLVDVHQDCLLRLPCSSKLLLRLLVLTLGGEGQGGREGERRWKEKERGREGERTWKEEERGRKGQGGREGETEWVMNYH